MMFNFFTIMNRNFWAASGLSSITSLPWVGCYSHCAANDNFSNVPGTAVIIGQNLHWPHLSKGKDRKKKHHPFSFSLIYRHVAAAGDSVRRNEDLGNSHRHMIFLGNCKQIPLMVSNLLIYIIFRGNPNPRKIMPWFCYFSYSLWVLVVTHTDWKATISCLTYLCIETCVHNFVRKYFQILEALNANKPPSLSQKKKKRRRSN